MRLCHQYTEQGRSADSYDCETYHIESDDIAKRDVAGLVPLDEGTIDEDGTAAGGQTQNKGLLGSGVEGVDALWRLGVSRSFVEYKDRQYAPIM